MRDQPAAHKSHGGYGNTNRKLYALVVIESFSRMLYVEFTHSQNQQTLHSCLINAFKAFGGTPQTVVVDNMLTAVTERQSRVIRFSRVKSLFPGYQLTAPG